MECCAEIQQCNLDNKEFSKRKFKYESILTSPNQASPARGNNPQLEASFLIKIEELKE